MRSIEGYPDPGALVTRPAKSITLRGLQREVMGVSLTRSLGTGLPAQVPGSDSMVAATGEVTWEPSKLIEDEYTLPWGDVSGLPVKGDAVNVAFGLQDETGVPRTARILTGVADSNSGAASDPVVTSQVVDRVDRLHKRIDIGPLWYRHPNPSQGGAPMAIGLHPSYVTDRVARRCGYYATPPMHSGAVLSAPMMGSMWPERGTLTAASGNGVPYPTYRAAPWGLTMASADATYRPFLPTGVTGSLDTPFFTHFLLSDGISNGAVRITAEWPDSSSWIMRLTDGTLTVERRWSDGTITTITPIFLPSMPSGELDVAIWVDYNGVTRVRFNGGTAHESFAMTPTVSMRTQPLASVRVQTSGITSMGLGGFQAGFAPLLTDLHTWTRNSLIETVPYGELFTVPSVVDRDCFDLLKEQAAAEWAAIWLDEDGRLRYRHRDVVVSQPVSDTLTFDNVADLPWDESWGSVRSQVDVSFRRFSARQGRYQTITAWQGSGSSMDVDEVSEQVLHPEDGGDWIGVDTGLAILDNAAAVNVFNTGRTSFIGGVMEVDGEVYANATATHFTHTFQKLDARSYLLRIETHNFNTTTQFLQKTSPNNTTIYPSKRGFDLPIVRANLVTSSVEESVTGATRGPATAPTMKHDASWWVQRAVDAQRMADYAASYVSDPRPVLRDVPVNPDDRRQLGDVYHVPLGEGRPKLRVLCVAIRDDYSTDGREQVLTLQTIAEDPA